MLKTTLIIRHSHRGLIKSLLPLTCVEGEEQSPFGWSVGRSVGWSDGFNTNFKKVWKFWLGNCTECKKGSVPKVLMKQLYDPFYSTCVNTAAPDTAPDFLNLFLLGTTQIHFLIRNRAEILA